MQFFSDTHGFSRGMINAVEEYKPDQVIHLGDGMNDAEKRCAKCFRRYRCAAFPATATDTMTTRKPTSSSPSGRSRHFHTRPPLCRARRQARRAAVRRRVLRRADSHVRAHAQGTFFDQIGGIFVLNPGTAGKAPRRTWAKSRDHARRHGKLRYLRYRLLVYKKS